MTCGQTARPPNMTQDLRLAVHRFPGDRPVLLVHGFTRSAALDWIEPGWPAALAAQAIYQSARSASGQVAYRPGVVCMTPCLRTGPVSRPVCRGRCPPVAPPPGRPARRPSGRSAPAAPARDRHRPPWSARVLGYHRVFDRGSHDVAGPQCGGVPPPDPGFDRFQS